MKRRDQRKEELRVIRHELDVVDELARIATRLSPTQVAKAKRRIEYTVRIVGALPLGTEALMVAISEVASAINDPHPPSVVTVRRWLYRYLTMGSRTHKIFGPESACDPLKTGRLYEE